MTNYEFKMLRDLIHRESRIFLGDGKKDFLRTRVEKRLKALNFRSIFQYYQFVTADNRGELDIFLDTVTINETSFFRNMPQFDLFHEKILPELTERKRREGRHRLTIWSAGCATGEEPYSIAMDVAATLPDTPRWEIKIIASDISLRCLETASRGRYAPERLKDVPDTYVSRFFKPVEGLYEMNESIRRFVIFDYHNLRHEHGLTDVDVIFCRNVMIYFSSGEQEEVIARFSKALNPRGYLLLGHAETLQGTSYNDSFKFLYWKNGTAYQKTIQM